MTLIEKTFEKVQIIPSFLAENYRNITYQNMRVMQKIFDASPCRLNGDPFNKDRPITSFWDVLDTQCVRFRHQESELYPMDQKY